MYPMENPIQCYADPGLSWVDYSCVVTKEHNVTNSLFVKRHHKGKCKQQMAYLFINQAFVLNAVLKTISLIPRRN